MQKQELETLSPYDNFVYALRAKETKRQYPHRLDKFLSYLGLEGTIEEKCSKLYEIGEDSNLLYYRLIKFIEFQKQRIETKEISEGTLCNYVKAIKLFCNNSICDISISTRIPFGYKRRPNMVSANHFMVCRSGDCLGVVHQSRRNCEKKDFNGIFDYRSNTSVVELLCNLLF